MGVPPTVRDIPGTTGAHGAPYQKVSFTSCARADSAVMLAMDRGWSGCCGDASLIAPYALPN